MTTELNQALSRARLRLDTLLDFLASLSPFKRLLLAFLLGGMGALAFAPFSFVAVLFLAFPGCLALLRGCRTTGQAFYTVFFFALGHLLPNLYWIAGALFVDIASFWWVLPFAVLGLPALLALAYGAMGALVYRFGGVRRPSGVLLFALGWFLVDMGRAHLFTGFPWNILGYVWADELPILQLASLCGVSGLTLLTAVLAVLPALFFDPPQGRVRVVIGAHCGALLLLLCAALWGSWRLHDASFATVDGTRLRLVQTAYSQDQKWNMQIRSEQFKTLLELSFAPRAKMPTHIIWPETATAYYLGEDLKRRMMIAEALPKGAQLITGTVQRAWNEYKGAFSFYNSLIVIDKNGHTVAGYDKSHLVPFGEYIPYRDYLPLPVVSSIGLNFTAGSGERTLRIDNLPPFSPLVCYEAIFSGAVVDPHDRSSLMINITNDAWYDGTIGPAQHFAIVKLRAIEEGIPLARVANKGITAMVDSVGRVRGSLGPDMAAFLDVDLPVALPEPTLFSRFGGKISTVLAVFLGFFVAFLRRREDTHRKLAQGL